VWPDGLADVVPTDQGSVPSFRRIAIYARALIRATASSHRFEPSEFHRKRCDHLLQMAVARRPDRTQ